MSGKIAGWGLLIIAGIIVADILIHPKGTTAAGNAAIGFAVPTYDALLGTAPKGG